MQISELLQLRAEGLVQQIQNNLSATGTNATGKTSQGIQYEITTEGELIILQITANPFTEVVETGRRPTPDQKPGYSMIQNLTSWAGAIGLLQGSNTGIVWAIATKINQEGTDLWQKGGRTDIYTEPSSQFTEQLSKDILGLITEDFVKLAVKFNDGSRNGNNS